MKKRFILAIAAVIVMAAASLAAAIAVPQTQRNYAAMQELYEDIYPAIRVGEFYCYYEYYGYTSLCRKSQTIAIVTPKTALTAEDSNGKSGIGSERQVTALHFFENRKKLGDEFVVTEFCKLLSNGSVVCRGSCRPMLKGNNYLLFLDDNNEPLQDANGMFDLSNLRLNERLNVWVEVLSELDILEYQADTKDCDMLIKRFFSSEIVANSSSDEFAVIDSKTRWDKITVTTEYTDKNMALDIYYAETGEEYLFKTEGYIYSLSKNYENLREMYEDIYRDVRVKTVCHAFGSRASAANHAKAIAIVTANDELTAERSEIDEATLGASSMRQITALRFIKNECGLEGTFDVTDNCGLHTDGTLWVEENCWPMLQDNCYAVFLDGERCTVGWNFSKIDLTNLRLNGDDTNIIRLLGEWNMLEISSGTENAAELVAGFLGADYIAGPSYSYYEDTYGVLDWQPIVLTTDYTAKGMEIVMEYAEDEAAHRILYRLDKMIYV